MVPADDEDWFVVPKKHTQTLLALPSQNGFAGSIVPAQARS